MAYSQASPGISAFLLEAGSRLVVESTKREAADLRALLRFLSVHDMLETDLGTVMASAATWRPVHHRMTKRQ